MERYTSTYLYVLIDNSNVWIEGKRASGLQKQQKPNVLWRLNLRALLDTITNYYGPDARIMRALLVGSVPPPVQPPVDSVWKVYTNSAEVISLSVGER